MSDIHPTQDYCQANFRPIFTNNPINVCQNSSQATERYDFHLQTDAYLVLILAIKILPMCPKFLKNIMLGWISVIFPWLPLFKILFFLAPCPSTATPRCSRSFCYWVQTAQQYLAKECLKRPRKKNAQLKFLISSDIGNISWRHILQICGQVFSLYYYFSSQLYPVWFGFLNLV